MAVSRPKLLSLNVKARLEDYAIGIKIESLVKLNVRVNAATAP